MIDYRRMGAVSAKPHTVFEVGGKMVAEHVFTRDGFSDLYSILYQERAPTHEISVSAFESNNPYFPAVPNDEDVLLKRRHVPTSLVPAGGNLLSNRVTLYHNSDVAVGVCKPSAVCDHFFVNGDADELFFVSEGGGTLQSMFGELDYHIGDYVYVPKGTPYKFMFTKPQNFLIVEGRKSFGIPSEYRHPQGQLKLDAPFTHRDFRSPDRLFTNPNQCECTIVVKKNQRLSQHTYNAWPYRVVGWDGWVYPFAFSIDAYQPKTSSLHLPPSSHMSFSGIGFVMMNFVPRIVDTHPLAIPCPYPHSSVDCDEVLFYVRGNFTSRKGIAPNSISFHPGGIPHGPHPEKYEASVGSRHTDEMAVMVDTFAPLKVTAAALKYEDPAYHLSWDSEAGL